MADDDLEAYMDPELDPVSGVRADADGPALPGPLTLPRLVAGVNVVGALAFVPFAWVAFRDGGSRRPCRAAC